MALPKGYPESRTPIPVYRGKEGKMNGDIILHLVTNGPATIYSIASILQESSENTIHYSTINRRIHDLEERDYVVKYRKVETKSGIETVEYATTIRGDFASMVLEMTPTQRRKMLTNAGRRKASPFLVVELAIENGVSEPFQKLLAISIASAVKNKHIDLELTSEGVLCAAFASIIGYRIKRLLALDNGDMEKVLEAMRYLIFSNFTVADIIGYHNEPLFPVGSDILAEAKRASQKKDFQDLFGPDLERQPRSMNSQYQWMTRLYCDLVNMNKRLGS